MSHRIAALTALAALGLAGTARAQIDLESVAFDREVVLSAGGTVEEGASFRVEVRGTGITDADLEKPDQSVIDLTEDSPGVFSASFAFADEDALDADFPAAMDDYTLTLNGGARVVEIDYQAPELPVFVIDSPVEGSDNNSPTTTPFTFGSCPPASCPDTSDHVRLSITQGGGGVAGGIEDDPAAGAWTPEDGDGVPVVLPEGANLLFVAELRANRPDFRVVDLEDFFTFWNGFRRSDDVAFSTGFRGLDEAPVGSFSIDGGDPTAFAIPSGPVMTELGGVALDFDYSVSPKGKITGTGAADVNDDDVDDVQVEVKGSLKEKSGGLNQKLTIKVKSKVAGAEASAKYTREELLDRDAATTDGSEQLKGKVLGVKVDETAAILDSIAGAVDGFVLDFDLSTEDGLRMDVSNAMLTVGSRQVSLEGGGKYDADQQRTQLSLKSTGDDKGAQVKITGLEVDDMDQVVAGTVSVKAFGQKVEIEIP